MFILLDKPVTEKQKLQVLIDGKIEKQVKVKWKNYYTLTFNIPGMYAIEANVNISLIFVFQISRFFIAKSQNDKYHCVMR